MPALPADRRGQEKLCLESPKRVRAADTQMWELRLLKLRVVSVIFSYKTTMGSLK